MVQREVLTPLNIPTALQPRGGTAFWGKPKQLKTSLGFSFLSMNQGESSCGVIVFQEKRMKIMNLLYCHLFSSVSQVTLGDEARDN